MSHILGRINQWLRQTGEFLKLDNPRFAKILLLGLLLRFLVMPFFCHMDFYSEQRRIHLQVEHANLYPGSGFVIQVVEAVNYWLVSPLLTEADSMFYIDDINYTVSSHQDFFAFVSHDTIFRTLFLLKLGYLLFDLAAAILIYRFTADTSRSLIPVAFWLFNPVTLFAFYIFGRYESISLFFLIAGFYMYKQDRVLLASLMFGCCMWGREAFLLVLPLLLIGIFTHPRFSWKARAISVGMFLFFMGMITNIVPKLLGFRSLFDNAIQVITGYDQVHQIIAFNVGWYYPIIVIYVLLAYYLIISQDVEWLKLLKAVGLFFVSFFMFAIHSVHYVAWLLPFVVLALPYAKHMRLAAIGFFLAWVAFWIVGTDLGVFSAWLAAPISLDAVNLPNIPVLLEQLLPYYTTLELGHVNAIFRSVMFAAFMFVGIQLLRAREEVQHA